MVMVVSEPWSSFNGNRDVLRDAKCAPVHQQRSDERTWEERAPDPVDEFEDWLQHAILWCDNQEGLMEVSVAKVLRDPGIQT